MRVERGTDTLTTFLLRTGYVGTEALEDPGAAADPLPAAPRPADSYAAAVALGESLDDLPSEEAGAPPSSSCMRPLGLRVEAAEFIPDDAPRAWHAEIAPSFVAACFPHDSVLAGLRAPEPDELTPEPEAPAAGDAATTALAGAFRHEADGRYTFLQPASLADGTAVLLLGERVGLDALPAPPVIPEAAP
jgi:hypothetical protein